MGSEYSKELNLAAKLNVVCDENGKEKDITKSVPILHRFGKLYRNRSPDKISLIQSSVFFNAALARQPLNCTVKKDLEELCSHVVELASFHLKEKKILRNISMNIQSKIIKMRTETNHELQKLKIIPLGLPMTKLRKLKVETAAIIQKLQASIANSYIHIMDNVSSECIAIMAKPPCQYAVIGMGSLSRQEITPYSDFEHVILLEEGVQHHPQYQDILEYFRWYTILFHLIIINLDATS